MCSLDETEKTWSIVLPYFLIKSGYVFGHNYFICLNDKNVSRNWQITVTDPLLPTDSISPDCTRACIKSSISIEQYICFCTKRRVYGSFNIWSMKQNHYQFCRMFFLHSRWRSLLVNRGSFKGVYNFDW